MFKKNAENRKISIAITTYNRSAMVLESVQSVLNDERVSEIIVRDDCSNISTFDDLCGLLLQNSKKCKILRNEKNRGPFDNKVLAVSECKSDWTILLDSDNSIEKKYLDKLFDIKQWSEDQIYCPSYARPKFDMRYFSGKILTINEIKKECLKGDRSLVKLLLNTGNYFVPTKKYVDLLKPFLGISVTASDVLAANYIWLSNMNKLKVVKGLEYDHRIHAESSFIKDEQNAKKVGNEICDHIANGNSASTFFGR